VNLPDNIETISTHKLKRDSVKPEEKNLLFLLIIIYSTPEDFGLNHSLLGATKPL
jgi:hypothetical protein